MLEKWLNLFLHFSGYIFSLKQKIVEAKSWTRALPYAILLILAELVFIIFSLPLYLAVSPKKLQERGFIFPTKEKEPEHFHIYAARRKISLATALGAGGIFLLKFVFVGLVSTYLLGAPALLAATQNWDMSTAGDYTYDGAKIEVMGGVAQLVNQGTGGNCSGTATACNTFVASPTCVAQGGCAWGGGASGATTNPDFTSNSTGWTGADWLWSSATETRVSTGGNPTGYIQISAPKEKNILGGGYWYQAFTTTVADPTVTVSFDWSSIGYTAGATVTAYVFVDTASGAPIIGTQVWKQTITGVTGWTSVANIDVSDKVTTARTHYLKVAYYINNGTGNTGPFTIGFDNVVLNWSKTGVCSGTVTTCNTFVTSPTCVTQGGCSWNSAPVYASTSPSVYPNSSLAPAGVTAWQSFAETATKNGGAINYQLTSDEGATWKYWNNSVWVTATTTANVNSASVVNSNINLFSAAAGKIKWKAFLASDGSQQVILDNVQVGYTQNSPPSVQNLTAAQNTSSGYVHVNYNLQDNNSDPASLVNYEYSLNGTFSDALPMTPVPADPAHSGISGLSSSPAGVAHTFVWNARNDLGNIFSNTVYVRLRAYDGIANSDFLASSAFSVDYVLPVVSGVTATQAPASTNVQISYNLADDTADNILVELQVSSNGGSTWAVPVASVSGDVGSPVSGGNNKSIIWQAGTDYANQEQNNIMVRLRAKDKYQNQGGYIDSAAFVLDNRAPVIATPANLLAQPLAGATAVLVGGSFTEGNPNTNNFYVAINDGSYGPAQPGDANTATPADKTVPVGVTLDGNDYISAVKIEHTDDFGQMTANENASPNSAYKYVKPYTPSAPTVDNPSESSLDVTINANPSDTSDLEYAIFENTQNKYVQSDGSLGASPDWQAVSTVTVTGLSQPVSQYSFKVKSRNPSDGSHVASSESDFGSAASSDYQSPNITINGAAQTTDGTKYVVINYTGADYQNQANNLIKYEYSLNGTDWQTMTEKSGVGSAGVTGLPFTNSGANLIFSWDVETDLPNVEDSAVYARLESNDSVTNGNIAVSPAFVVDTAGPVVSNIQVSQTPATNNVAITYDLADSAGANNVVALSVSDDSGATYNVLAPSVSGAVGGGVTAGLARSMTWNVGADLVNQEKSTMKIKIAATDSYGNIGNPVESADFSADTKAPVISAVAAGQGSGSALVVVTYNLADLSQTNVEFEVSADSGATWNVATTTYTGETGSGQTAGAKTFNWNAAVDFPDQELTTMRLRVRATDNFAHQSAYQESADFSLNTKVLSIANITAEQNIGAKTVTLHYDLNKIATINLDISSDGGMTWNVATTTLSGQIGSGITAGNNKIITWNAGTDFNNEEKASMRVRFSGIDSLGTVSPYYESADFSMDTAAPLSLLSLSKFASMATSATMNWSSGIADAHFNHYELWHGANQNDVINRAGTAVKWSTANDANLNVITTISTVITGLNLTGDYYVKIWAIDDYGNEAAVAELNIYSAPISTPLPVVENVSGGGSVIINNITDTMSPGKPILSSLSSPTNITSINISGLAEAGSRIDLYNHGILVQRLNNVADNNGQFSQIINFSDGEHVLTVKAVDFSNNISEVSIAVSLRIKTTLPNAPVVLSPKDGDKITADMPVLIGVAEPLSQVEIILDGKNKFTAAANLDGAWQFKLAADFVLKDGVHSFALVAIDQAGNKSAETVVDINKIALPIGVAKTPVAPPAVVTVTVPAAAPAPGLVSMPLPAAQLVRENTQAVELAGVPIPLVTNVNTAVANNVFTFTGSALPNQDVIVYLHSDQALIYSTKADSHGVWQINHSQNLVELTPGEHTIYAVAIDPDAKIKSQPSLVSTFTVSKNFWVSLFEQLNFQTTVITLAVILLSMLWLYQIKKRETVNA